MHLLLFFRPLSCLSFFFYFFFFNDTPTTHIYTLSLHDALPISTTRTGLLTAPLFSRFGHVIRLDFYPPEDLRAIVERTAHLLGVEVDPAAAREIATRARGTPRIANRLFRRIRDFAEVLGSGKVDMTRVVDACARLEVDQAGLDEMDRRYLSVIIDHYDGGPVGVDALAAALAEPRDTLEDVLEPFLIQQGYVGRTPRGRVANRKAYEAIGRSAPKRGDSGEGGPQEPLF